MAGDIRTGRDTQVGGFGPIKDTGTGRDTTGRQGAVPGHPGQGEGHQSHQGPQAQGPQTPGPVTQAQIPVTGAQGPTGHTGSVPAEAPTGAGPAPGTGTAQKAATATGSHRATLLAHEECDQYTQRLHHTVSGFVDGPRDAVEDADRVLQEIASRFTEAVAERRRTLRTSWQNGAEGGPSAGDTEQLRLALRDYRELAERLLKV